ncbi:heavy-metal-associated domain-containing protein [Streptomyces sp. NBC_01276]|uniref:heavy-metal-associated domain-containing protein n=1 Tax=Streptomyces sp. NBC_01276 TaxID=2903808 RepID=UPI00352DE5E8
MTEQRYRVTGMSCGHCAERLTREVALVPGVSGVAVDLGAQTVTVSGEPLDEVLIRDAITGAGYGVAAVL